MENFLKPRSEDLKLPFPRSYWVIAGRLLAGLYPGSQDQSEAIHKLRGLLNLNVDVILNLMEKDETNYAGASFVPYESQLQKMAGQQGRKVVFIEKPFRDGGVPTRIYMASILNQIDAALGKDQTIYLHCWGGRGRTGTVVGCFLRRHGLASIDNVLSKIEGLRGKGYGMVGNSPETDQQRAMVLAWEEGD